MSKVRTLLTHEVLSESSVFRLVHVLTSRTFERTCSDVVTETVRKCSEMFGKGLQHGRCWHSPRHLHWDIKPQRGFSRPRLLISSLIHPISEELQVVLV